MAIRYEAFTKEGERVTGVLPVDSPATAEQVLWESDLIVASLAEFKPERRGLRQTIARYLPTLFRVRPDQVVGMTREMATLLDAGIPLREALVLMEERVVHPQLRSAMRQIATDIEQGTSLSEAVRKHPSVFPDLYARLLVVGEETGTLSLTLKQIAHFMEQQHAVMRQLTRSLRYPALVLLLGGGAAVYMVVFSLPALTELLQEFGGDLPLVSRILIVLGSLAKQFGPWVLAALGAIGLGLAAFFRTERGKEARDAWVFRIPVVGPLVQTVAMFRLTSSLSAMTNAGLPLVEALTLAARVVGNRVFQRLILRVREEITQGNAFSHALRREPLVPAFVPQLVAIGEEAGNLGQQLQTVSDFFSQETEQRIANLTGMVEPALTVVMGGGVGFVAIAVMSSVYGALGQIG